MRSLAILLFSCLPVAALAQTPASPQIMADVKSGDFQAAESLAAATGDPLMSKLVTFFRLTDPGGGTADEINAFIAANPDWPDQALLARRAAEAAGIPPQPAFTPTPLFLQQIATLQNSGQNDQAAALWTAQAAGAAATSSPAQQLMFWPAANSLARSLLAGGDAKTAYAVTIAIAPPASAHEQIADRQFLAGFLSLRFLHAPSQAAIWFIRLANSSDSVITQARAWYWLGRAQSGPAAAADYTRAASYPDTFYGQLAALAIGDDPAALANRILATGEPSFTAADALNFALMELPRAAALLTQMNDPQDAALFLNRLGQIAPDDRTRELAAKLALGLGLPQSAVAIARIAGADGQMLVREGWPTPLTPPATLVEPAIVDGIIRQESSFDAGAISGAGAVGLMQLLPSTARNTARKAGLLYSSNLFDPQENLVLGTAYIAELEQSFGNCLPLAIAAYNAGPTNVAHWLAQNGDPELGHNTGGADIIDWIEEIPFSETRNYVQRVTEGIVIYRALLTGTAEDPVSPWLTK